MEAVWKLVARRSNGPNGSIYQILIEFRFLNISSLSFNFSLLIRLDFVCVR